MPPVSRFRRLPPNLAANVTIHINGKEHSADARWTVAAALIAHGYTHCRCDAAGERRGPFCLVGVCFECLVDIDGTADCQACLTPVRAGMNVIFAKQTRALP